VDDPRPQGGPVVAGNLRQGKNSSTIVLLHAASDPKS
jgi:hypothetical protein